MPRYAIKIEYNGTNFAGWQRQENAPSIQQAIEDAIAKMTGESVPVQGAGRTDAGVHAWGQVAHFDLGRDWSVFRLSEGLNYHLRPHPIAILETRAVDDQFSCPFWCGHAPLCLSFGDTPCANDFNAKSRLAVGLSA